MTPVRLGSAEIKIVWNDDQGLVVTHGQDSSIVLAGVAPEKLDKSDWDSIWNAINKIVTEKGGFRYPRLR